MQMTFYLVKRETTGRYCVGQFGQFLVEFPVGAAANTAVLARALVRPVRHKRLHA